MGPHPGPLHASGEGAATLIPTVEIFPPRRMESLREGSFDNSVSGRIYWGFKGVAAKLTLAAFEQQFRTGRLCQRRGAH